MMGQQFRLGLGSLGKARLQPLGNPLVILLSRAPEQRLIRHLPDEGVLEVTVRSAARVVS
jgi:hypothetical protein